MPSLKAISLGFSVMWLFQSVERLEPFVRDDIPDSLPLLQFTSDRPGVEVTSVIETYCKYGTCKSMVRFFRSFCDSQC